MACRLKALTHWIVTVDRTPRAPSPTRATSSRSAFCSGVQSWTTPDPSMRRIPMTAEEMLRNRAPVPWVAVWVAPAIDW